MKRRDFWLCSPCRRLGRPQHSHSSSSPWGCSVQANWPRWAITPFRAGPGGGDYVEGRNRTVICRSADNQFDRLRARTDLSLNASARPRGSRCMDFIDANENSADVAEYARYGALL